jgi:hypothetical protein
LSFIPRESFPCDGNKTIASLFALGVSIGSELATGSFEQLATPHFERFYDFPYWLTHDR